MIARRPVRALSLALGLALTPLAACDAASPRLGVNTPMVVEGAQFFEAPLPAPGSDGPIIKLLSAANTVVYPGAAEKSFDGRVDDRAVAIALGLPSLSDTHWVFPASSRSPEFPGDLLWSALSSFSRNIPPGRHPLVAAGVDAFGVVGPHYALELCFSPTYPDNGATCNPARELPAFVITLDWDAEADVDLELSTPEGRRVSAKRPLVIPPGQGGIIDPESPRIDRDSMASCVPDGWRQEAIAFMTRPTGRWELYARLFDGCDEDAVRYRLRIYERQLEGDVPALVVVDEYVGIFVTRFDADGGEGAASWITGFFGE